MFYGGPGGSRTRVQKSFALKELQQYDIYYTECRNLCQVICIAVVMYFFNHGFEVF